MKLSETRSIMINEIEFPVSSDEVMEKIGDICIESPNNYEEEVADALRRCGDDVFESPEELYDTVFGMVSGEYVGRKNYDDRGPNLRVEEDEEVSF